MLTIFTMYRHYRRTGVGAIAALRRAYHVYHHGF